MVDDNNRTRVVTIADPGPTQDQIAAALEAEPSFDLIGAIDTLDDASRKIRSAGPDLVLVDHQVGKEPSLDAIDALVAEHPEISVVAMLPGDDMIPAQQVMLAGARAFLVQPFTQETVLATLRRVRDLETQRAQFYTSEATRETETTEPVRILTVFSPRGGVGCSTVAANLALALLEETGQRVLLMDGKLQFGHLGLMLNIRTPASIADLIPHARALDEELVAEVIAEHDSGLHVLLRPADVEVAQGIRPEDLFNVLRGVSRMYDFIVIDGGSTLNENTVTLMDAADRILLVTTPDLSALHDVSRFLHVSGSLAYPPSKLLVILNRAGVLGGVKTHDIEKALLHRVFAVIPEDGASALRSVNRGIPLVLRYRRKPVARAIQRLAKSLVEAAEEEPASSPALSPSVATRLGARLGMVRTG